MTTTTEKTKKAAKPEKANGGKAKASKAKPEKAAKWSLAALQSFAAKAGLVGGDNLDAMVAETRTEMKRQIDAGAAACICTVCGEPQPDDLVECPFCGDKGIIEDATERAPEPATEPEPGTALAEVVHQAEPVVVQEMWTKERLDAETAEIKEAVQNAAGEWWGVGHKLLEIHRSEAWKAGEFKNFRAYCTDAVGCSHTFAYNLMGAAEKFSQADFRMVGTTKLTALLKAPEEDQSALLDRAKSGATARDLAKEAKEAKARKANPAKETTKPPREAPPRESETRGRPRKDDQNITLLAKVNGKPIRLSWRTKATPKLKAWKEGAYAEIKLSEFVSAIVELTHPTGKDGDEVETDGIQVTFVSARTAAG